MTNMRYAVTTTTNPETPYVGTLWDEIQLPFEVFSYIEDAMELAFIFNSATKSSDFMVVEQQEG